MLFDQTMQPVNGAPGVWAATVSDNWSVNGNPNGGYLMALMAGAVLARTECRKASILTANFIARCIPGPAEIRLEEIVLTRHFHRFEARLVQQGKEKVRALATFARESTEAAISRYETAATPLAPRELCVPVPALPAYTLFEQLDVLLDPACAGWMHDRLADRSETKGWIRFKDARPHDLLSVLVIADALPPAVMATQGMMAWVPTIEMSVNLRSLPQSPWLNCCLRTRSVTSGILEADGEVWDEAGSLVAISRQIARIHRR